MSHEGAVSPSRLAIGPIIVFPLVGPAMVLLALFGPLAVAGLFAIGPGGLFYYLFLGAWSLPQTYALLGAPFLLAGILVSLAGLIVRPSLLVALVAAEIAFLICYLVWYLAPGALAALAPSYADVWTGFLRAPMSILFFLAASAACWFVARRIGGRVWRARPGTAAAQGSRRQAAMLAAIAVAGAAALAGLAAASGRLPAFAWEDCTEGTYDRRIRGCTIVIERGSKEPVDRRIFAHMRRASVYREFGFENLPGALADYTAAIDLDPGLAEAYAGRGLVHEQFGEDEAAIADLDEALRLDPAVFGDGQYGLFRARGLANFRIGEFDRAIADHSEEMRLAPRYADGYLHRGAAHLANDDPENALADFSEAIRVEPYRSGGYVERGSIYLARGEHDRALADFDEAIRRLPNHYLTASAYRRRGEVLEIKGELDASLAAFEIAASLDPSDAEAIAGRERVRAALPK